MKLGTWCIYPESARERRYEIVSLARNVNSAREHKTTRKKRTSGSRRYVRQRNPSGGSSRALITVKNHVGRAYSGAAVVAVLISGRHLNQRRAFRESERRARRVRSDYRRRRRRRRPGYSPRSGMNYISFMRVGINGH